MRRFAFVPVVFALAAPAGAAWHQVDRSQSASPDGVVEIEMTLTSPGCPVAQTFPGMVEQEIRRVPDVTAVHVELVWDPPWTQDRLTDEVRLALGLL